MSRRIAVLVGLVPALIAGLVAFPAAAGAASPSSDPATVAVVDPTQGLWYLRDAHGGTTAFFFGNPGDSPFMGDWDCDGVDTPGLYRRTDGFVYLRNSNTQGVADVEFFFGNPGDVPVPGDFDGDGCDTVSIYRPAEARFYVIDRLGAGNQGLGAADEIVTFGNPGDSPVVGDFDADGVDELGLHRPAVGLFYYKDAERRVPTAAQFVFGDPGDALVAGDWDGDGTETVGAFRFGTFLLKNANAAGDAEVSFPYGAAFMLPVAGRFGTLPGRSDPPPVRTGPLQQGARGAMVSELQSLLAQKGFYRGPISGVYGSKTSQAVMAFHKANRLPRAWDWKSSDWALLAAFEDPDNVPNRPGEPNRMEVDITRQVAHLYKSGRRVATFPISSGNGELFRGSTGNLIRARTPRGNFKFGRHIAGMRISYLGELWRPWYFIGGYAIHGSPSVPSYPASHGCVRVPMWDADWLESRLYLGMPIHVWD